MSRLLGSIFIIAGTSIGAGMLALPIPTGLLGVYPATAVLLAVWANLLFSSLLYLEMSFWMKDNESFVSLSKRVFGPVGQRLTWLILLYLLYSLVTAYLAGGSKIIVDLVAEPNKQVGLQPLALGVMVACLAGLYFSSFKKIDHLNKAIIFVLFSSFVFLVQKIAYLPAISNFEQCNLSYLPISLSIIFTSFGYHFIIPRLLRYLRYDLNQTKRALFFGSLIPFGFYLTWICVAIRIIPIPAELEAQTKLLYSSDIIDLLASAANGGDEYLAQLMIAFSLSAIVSSFLGVGTSLLDSLQDALKSYSKVNSRFLLVLLAFLPPVVLIEMDANIFLSSLKYAGTFGAVSLLNIYPALLVWKARSKWGASNSYSAPGGRKALILVLVLSFVFMITELYRLSS